MNQIYTILIKFGDANPIQVYKETDPKVIERCKGTTLIKRDEAYNKRVLSINYTRRKKLGIVDVYTEAIEEHILKEFLTKI